MKHCALLRLPIVRRTTAAAVASSNGLTSSSSLAAPSQSPNATQRRFRGDFNSNTFHNSNPQHGAAYDQQERKCRDDEIEDFLLSVKGWDHNPNTDAIKKTFVFENFDQSYEFMGRLFAFCWGVDKYTPITWHGNTVKVELYSAHFKGLSKRELKIAAFCNDHFNMIRKSHQQVQKLKDFAGGSVMEEIVGREVKAETAVRDAVFNTPAPEASKAPTDWAAMLGGAKQRAGQ